MCSQEAERIMKTNYLGAYIVSQAFIPVLNVRGCSVLCGCVSPFAYHHWEGWQSMIWTLLLHVTVWEDSLVVRKINCDHVCTGRLC